VNGLLERGYEVAILHRGTHEVDEIPPEVEHIHTDPHFVETLEAALTGRRFDVCVATYGRLRHVAAVMRDKAEHFISVGGTPYKSFFDPDRLFPFGGAVPFPETDPYVDDDTTDRMAPLLVAAERTVFEHHPTATHFRYPYIYGAYQLVPREWSIVRRLLDKRPYIVLPDGGWYLYQHGYAENVAHALLLSIDQRAVAAGKSYNCADERQLTLRQMVEVIAAEMGREIEIVSVPKEIASVARPFIFQEHLDHSILDLFKLKSELGYRDVVSPAEGFARTARWLAANAGERQAQFEGNLHDPFDYDAEDRLVKGFRDGMATLREFAWQPLVRAHAYAHPKKPGEVDHRGR
jgi:nucleoside-diphosphate-sugar epimerase